MRGAIWVPSQGRDRDPQSPSHIDLVFHNAMPSRKRVSNFWDPAQSRDPEKGWPIQTRSPVVHTGAGEPSLTVGWHRPGLRRLASRKAPVRRWKRPFPKTRGRGVPERTCRLKATSDGQKANRPFRVRWQFQVLSRTILQRCRFCRRVRSHQQPLGP